MLGKVNTADMDDDEFFKAYAEGKIPRKAGHLTEENWEEVRLCGGLL